ncbi:MAG: L,D-transpeptidase family protein [Hyphomicrobiaceae bacterium]
MPCDFALRRLGAVLTSSAIALWVAVPMAIAQNAAPASPAAVEAVAPSSTPVAVAAVESPAMAVPVAPSVEQLTPGETPAAVAAEPPPPPAPIVTAAPAVIAPVTDPVELAVRERLAKPIAGVDKADMAALVAFYAARTQGPVWTKDGQFTAPAQSVMTALRRANDWGLDAKAFVLPTISAGADTAALADVEIQLATAILKYARQASGGRVDPSSLSRFNDLRGTFANPAAVLTGIATAAKPDVYLEGLHPQHPQFQKLHEALVKALHGGPHKAEAASEPAKLALAAGPDIKPGAKHDDIALIRTHLGVAATAGSETTYDKPLVAAVKAFQEERGLKVNGIISAATRTALNGGDAKKKQAAADPAKEVERIALNMERWRWMPVDMGRFHILNNVPEMTTRVFKDGQIIHQEKIIVGKTNTPTSLFSANMQFVIFHPEWGVPDSIKLKEILPSLKRKTASEDSFFGLGPTVSDTRVLKKHNLRVSQNGRVVDASQIDWTKADPRAYSFIQPAGGTNVLGVVKFRFPNRHDIYMHDTPQRDLFSQSVRAFSHGCMRVNNPRRLAEVILAEDRGWSAEKVGSALAGGSQEVKMERPFPVHVGYFTARVDEDGKLRTFADLYGHDSKLASALAGKPVRLEDPAAASGSEPVAQAPKPKKGAQPVKQEASLGDVLNGLFGN